MKRCIVLALMIACSVPAIPLAERSPDFSFTIQAEKHIFKPGEPIWVLAFLRNQGWNEVYVPHAMSPCTGYESQVRFSINVVKGKETMVGRGCGVGSACGGGCLEASSFDEHVKTSWILLRPGELFGARFDSYQNAPDRPGIYKLVAEYEPQAPTTKGHAGTGEDQVRVITNSYQAQPVEIIVRR
jgi:hypothetical protein